MIKNVVREVPAESADFSFYFEGDTFTELAGDYCYNLFILTYDHGRLYGFNSNEFERVQSQACELQDGFCDVASGYYDWTYKDIMLNCDIPYSSTMCHKLKEWCNKYSPEETDGIAAFLSIITGHKWDYLSVSGYSQGDYCEVIFCKNFYDDESAQICGEIWLGCAKEFCVIKLDKNENEIDKCYGFIIADSQALHDNDYKTIICNQEGMDPEETRLELIDGYHTYTTYDYKAI